PRIGRGHLEFGLQFYCKRNVEELQMGSRGEKKIEKRKARREEVLDRSGAEVLRPKDGASGGQMGDLGVGGKAAASRRTPSKANPREKRPQDPPSQNEGGAPADA